MNKFVKCLDSTWFLVLALDLCLNSLQIKQKWFPNWSFPIYWSRSSGREILPEIIGNESNTYLHQLTYYFIKLYYTMYIINFFFVIKILMRFHAILAFIFLLAVFTCENGSIGEMLVHVMSLEIGQMFDSIGSKWPLDVRNLYAECNDHIFFNFRPEIFIFSKIHYFCFSSKIDWYPLESHKSCQIWASTLPG